jgi:hypothetical protein
MRPLLILFCLFACELIKAQSSLPAFGIYSGEEIDLKECPFDKNAGAVILLDEAVADHDEEWRLITHRRVRIKILDKREIDRGDIRIRFYSKDEFEYITDIHGTTTNYEDGRPVVSVLEKKSIFTEKEDNVFSSIKFAMPNVKAGSIIEYEYQSNMKHYGGLSDWIFQNDIPTVKSCYLLTVLPGSEFAYNVQKKSNYPIIIKPIPDVGKIYFEMNNIPGLKFEPYMDAVKDYLQRVEFQLSSYTSRFGNKTNVTQTWKDAAFDLLGDKEFGGAIRKDLPNTTEIKAIISGEITDSGKISSIYNYIRNNFTCTRDYGKYATDGLKGAWEKRAGSAGEINLILINLLQSFNIEVYPILVAERDFGKIDTIYPFLDRFNKVVAFAKANSKTFILDATQKYCPPGLTPYPLLNTYAFIVDKKNYNLVRILSVRNAYENAIAIDAAIDNKGMLQGTAEIKSCGYAKQLRTESIKKDRKKFITDILQEPGSELMVDDCSVENLDDDGSPLIQKIKFHNELNVSGGFVFFIYNLFTGFAKNPFTAAERFTNINFGYPYNINLKITLQLPEKAKIDKLPIDKELTSPYKSVYVYRVLKKENNTIIINAGFRQTSTLIGYNQYSDLKILYTQLTDLLNDPLVIKISE